MKPESASQLAVRMLGRFEVTRGSSPIPDETWGRRKTKALLKILLTSPGRMFSQDQLIERLFGGNDPEGELRNLHARVSELRRALEPDLRKGKDSAYILRIDHGYLFDTKRAWIDTEAFLELERSAEASQATGDHAKTAAALESAIRLCRGDLLEEDRYEEWTLEAREEWRERYVSALRSLSQSYAHLGDPHRAALACREAFALQPWRESILQELMRYHAMAGERSEVIQAYKQGIQALEDQLGVAPSPETVALREEVLDELSAVKVVVRDRLRIAVLPMVSIGPDFDEVYFADGMTEELIYKLSRIPAMKVIAQTSVLSYKGTKKTVAEVGRELNVGSVIEGSVRRADTGVRVTVQLIDTLNQEHLWAGEYDRPFRDVFAIQSEIAQSVAEALQVTMLDRALAEIETEPTVDPVAYELYLKGRHVMKGYSIRALESAIEYFEQALDLDPHYPLALAGFADAACCLWFFGNPPEELLVRARSAADLAVELTPARAEGYAAQARIRWGVEKDLEGAEGLFQTAIRLAPKDADLRRWYSRLLNQLGRKGEAFVEILKAQEIDPISSSTHLQLAEAYGSLGLEEDAARQLEEVLELHPQHLAARIRLAYARWARFDWKGAEVAFRQTIKDCPQSPGPLINYTEHLCALGRWDEARETLEKALALARRPIPIWVTESEGVLRYMLGEYEKARECLEASVAAQPQLRFSYWWLAMTYWMLGDNTKALATLDGAEAKMEGFYRSHREYMQLCIEFARGAVYARMGDVDRAREKIEQIKAMPGDLDDRALALAAIHFYLDEIETGIEWLTKSVERRDNGLRRFHCFDLHGIFRRVPRVAEIFARTGLPSPVPSSERRGEASAP